MPWLSIFTELEENSTGMVRKKSAQNKGRYITIDHFLAADTSLYKLLKCVLLILVNKTVNVLKFSNALVYGNDCKREIL